MGMSKKLKLVGLLFTTFFAASTLTACPQQYEGDEGYIDSLQWNMDEDTCIVGENYDLTDKYTIETRGNISDKVIFESTRPEVAVIRSGMAVTYYTGKTTIFVISQVNREIKDSFVLTVVDPPEVKSISWNFMEKSLDVGDTLDLSKSYTIDYVGDVNLGVTYSTSNEDIATISGNTLTCVGSGRCTISVFSNYNKGLKDKFYLTVYEGFVTGLEWAFESKEVFIGKSLDLNGLYDITVEHKAPTNVAFRSSNANIASINPETGVLTAHRRGTCEITVSSLYNPNFYDTFTLICDTEPKVLELSVEQEDIDMFADETISIKGLINLRYQGDTDKIPVLDQYTCTVVTEQDEEPIATVNKTGTSLHAISKGTAVVMIRSDYDYSKTASIQVHISEPITNTNSVLKVNWKMSTQEMIEGESLDLSSLYELEVVPGASQEVIISCNDRTVGYVANNILYAVGKGSAVVTLTPKADFAEKVSFTLVVLTKPAILSLVWDIPDTDMAIGVEMDLADYVIVEAKGGADESVTFSYTGDDCLTLDGSICTFTCAGTATLVATSVFDDTYVATIDVEVHNPQIVSIRPTSESRQMTQGNSVNLNDCVLIESLYRATCEVKFESSNSSVVSIDEEGYATAVDVGKATITATCVEDTTKTTTFKIEVVEGPSVLGISLSKDMIDIKVDQVLDLNSVATVEYKGNPLAYPVVLMLRAETEDSEICQIVDDSSARIKGIKVGTTTVTIISIFNPSIRVTLTVNVVE